MSLLAPALAWYAVVTIGGLAGCGLLMRTGVGSGSAAALGRLVAWSLAGYVAWAGGCLGWTHWWVGAIAVMAVLAAAAAPALHRVSRRDLLTAEVVGLVAFVVIAALRLPAMNVVGTEKPMDLAILATLLRPGAFPPTDPWLAGTSLPYYYWGFVPWIAPARLLRLAPDVAYNLIVPLIAAVTAQAAWGLARALGARRKLAWLAPLLVVVGGTPDGWRQLVSGRGLGGLDLWPSSRQIAGAITEFPLFTFSLGDLHPHLLALPFVLGALTVAVAAASGRPASWPLTAVLYGAAAAANPWYAAPLGAAVGLVLVAPPDGFRFPWRSGVTRWAAALGVGLAGWLLFAPFWLHYRVPYSGFGAVTTPARWDEMALFAGGVLALPVVVGWELSWRWGGVRREARQLMRAFWSASAVVVASFSGSVNVALAVATGGFLVALAVRSGSRPYRQSWLVGLVALALLAGMDLVYVHDPYGGDLYRMNTVFKASFLAFALLAVLTPVWGDWLLRRRRRLAVVLMSLAVVAGLPQLASLVLRIGPPPGIGWHGLAWMPGGDAGAVAWLRARPAGAVLVEGVGDAYSDAARLSAASGVPAVLGWENHESVWRGAAVGDELRRRRQLVEELYRCGDPARVRAIAHGLGATIIAVGSVERRLYPGSGLEAVLAAGPAAYSGPGCVLVAVGG